MTDNLHATLRAAIEQRGRVAEWHSSHATRTWANLVPPARILLDVARDLKVLERHRPVKYHRGRTGCDGCEGVSWPCDDIADLAAEYGIVEVGDA